MLAETVSCDVVKEFVDLNSHLPFDEQTILLVDCRPFFTYNESHIRDSVNVFCSKFLLRRKGQIVEKIFTDPLVRSRLMSDSFYHIVLYEEGEIASKDSIGALVANCLEEEVELNCVSFLEGGFTEFAKRYPFLCASRISPIFSTPTSNLAVLPTTTTMSSISTCSRVELQRYDSGLEVSETSDDSGQPFSTYTWPFKGQARKSPETIKKSCLQLNLQSINSGTHGIVSSGLPMPKETLLLDSTEEDELPEPSLLTPYLFIGSQTHSNSFDVLSQLGITAILNVSSSCPNYFERDFLYKRIYLRDTGDGDIQSVMNESIDFINQVRESQGKVLVHCRAGMSRSATMCIAYLIKQNQWSMDRAYEFVKSRRPQIAPNFSFMVQMMDFEKRLNRCSPTTTEDDSSTSASSSLS